MLKAILFAALASLSFLFSDGNDPSDANVNDYEWQLTFEDQFDAVDKSKWIFKHDNGVQTIWSNKELQWYKEENVVAEGGVLKLIAKKESIFGRDTESQKQFEYTSGMICNSKSFTQPYGKWEMKVRFPFSKGFWPAFFLVPIQRPTLPEIDVFEYFGVAPNDMTCTLHWGTDYFNPPMKMIDGQAKPFYFKKSKTFNGDFANRWMVWTCEIFPDKIIWKLDGNIVFESTEGIPTAPMYMIANVAVKDYPENDNKVDESGLPYVMEIDYVKVYKMVPKN
jgi:beta-glucanase (GH16 family)